MCILNVFLLSCAHRHSRELDDPSDSEPSPISLTINVYAHAKYHSFPHGSASYKMDNTLYKKRFVIEVRQGNRLISHQTLFPDSRTDSYDSTLYTAHLELQPQKYDIAVWADYIQDNTDCHYLTEHLNNIVCSEPYCGNTTSKECLYGHKTIDLRRFRYQENLHAETNMTIRPPTARYEIITTDVKEFIKQKGWRSDKKYRLKFSYLFFYPMVFDAYKGVVKDSWSNVSFDIPLEITDNREKECRLGFDYILADTTENSVMITLTVTDEKGKEIITGPPIQIPYRQGYSTKIKGRFLTKKRPGGIEINTEFDDEININIDNIFTY